MQCDTDSLFLWLAKATIAERVLPEKKDVWLKKIFIVSDSEEMVKKWSYLQTTI